jgi:DNA repair exonuclease SbcCD ATPase subunit
MFAKRSKQPSRPQETQPDAASGEAVPDPRDATIARLERELAEQRALAANLRESLDAATFKVEILEKSYAKQLAEARDKRAALEEELKEKEEILANLGGGHEHTLRELADAVAVIKVLKAERDQLRKQIAQGGFRQSTERAAPPPPPVDHTSSGDGTINQLIANAGWAEKKSAVGTGQATALVEDEPEAPTEEMLPPELVFTSKDGEKDDEA